MSDKLGGEWGGGGCRMGRWVIGRGMRWRWMPDGKVGGG